MATNPINKNQEVYTDRYGSISQNRGPSGPSQDYNSFDTGAEQPYASEFANREQAPNLQGSSDQDLVSGMNEADYEAVYRDQVEPQDRQEAQDLLDSVQGEYQNQDPPFDEKKAISDLKKKLNGKDGAYLASDAKNGYISQLGDLERKLKNPRTDPSQVADEIQSLQDEVTDAISSAKDSRNDSVSDLKSQIGQLKDTIDASHISARNKDQLKTQLQTLSDSLDNPSTNLNTATKSLADLNKAYQDTPLEWNNATILRNVPGDQNAGHQADTARLILNDINQAISSGNWTQVHNDIYKEVGYDASLDPDGGARNRKNWNDVIRKVVTAIYRASGSQDKTIAVLKNIPENIRYDMIDAASQQSNELSEKTDSDQFNTTDSIAMIRASIIPDSPGPLSIPPHS